MVRPWSTVSSPSIARMCTLAVLLCCIGAASHAQEARGLVKIGVLAKRGSERCLEKWGPTADYLTSQIPGYSFEVVPLGYDDVYPSVERAEVDFILANPAYYVGVERFYGASRIATFKNLQTGRVTTVFGGVVFCRVGRTDIQSLNDLKAKTFMATHEQSLGGWYAVWLELKENGIDPARHFAELLFGGTHDAVVYAVRDGEVDAGCVRTDELERMYLEGKIGLEDFRVIHQHEHDAPCPPFVHSTRLYPEWPIAKLQRTPDELAEKVAVALMKMEPESPAARAARCAGWTIPHHYEAVRDCLKALRVRPYEGYGRVSLREAVRQHQQWVLGAAAFVILIALFAVHLRVLNQMLRQAVAGQNRELAERRRAEEALRASETRNRTLLEALPQQIFYKDRNSVYVYANENYARDLGLTPDQIVGREDGDFHPEELAEKYRADDARIMASGQTQTIEEQYTRQGQRLVVLTVKTPVRDEQGDVVGVLGIFWDITEQKELEEQLRQAQKMEAVGELAGGMAHDFNNMLTVIKGNVEMLSRSLDDDASGQPYLSDIRKAMDQAGGLTRHLLAFGRRQVLEPEVLDLNQVVAEVTPMLQRLIEESIELVAVLEPELGRVEADPMQIEQVIVNLVLNARDAVPEGGQLTIETANVDLGENYRRQHPDAQVGPHVMLAVSDTGVGMDEEMQSRIFEPFFTTKDEGMGTGLGLSMVYGIVKQSGGNVHVYSEPGVGTTLRVYLPRVEREATPREETTAPVGSLEGSETILIVEDEELVRSVAIAATEAHGYHVLAAADGAEALRICEQHEGPIHLMVTDVIMPGMSGSELAERAAQIRPDMRVLYMSGYADNAIVHHGILEPGVHLLRKPFDPEDLARRARELLDMPEENRGDDGDD